MKFPCVSGEQFEGIKIGFDLLDLGALSMRYCPHQSRAVSTRIFNSVRLRGCHVAAFVYGRTAFRSCVNHLNFSITSAQRSLQFPGAFCVRLSLSIALTRRPRRQPRPPSDRPYGPSTPRLCTTIIVQDICFYSLCSESATTSVLWHRCPDLSSENQINCTARLMTTCPGNKNKLFRPRHKSFFR
jgi:hypothetical protein